MKAVLVLVLVFACFLFGLVFKFQIHLGNKENSEKKKKKKKSKKKIPEETRESELKRIVKQPPVDGSSKVR